MDDIVAEARNRLESLGKGDDLRKGDVRKVSSELYKTLEDKSIDNVFALCERLLDEREWPLGILAYDWAYRVRRQYDDKTFAIFERWLKEYVTGWQDCDDFCTHAFGELLAQNNELFTYVIEWTRDPNFCVRRASAVSLDLSNQAQQV
jgi:3-methyladenine DNA glycosylase AlkD